MLFLKETNKEKTGVSNSSDLLIKHFEIWFYIKFKANNMYYIHRKAAHQNNWIKWHTGNKYSTTTYLQVGNGDCIV